MSSSIEINNLVKNFSGEKAIAGVSFSVESGRLFGLIGADGAGKTTLMRILTTLITPDSGSAAVLGLDIIKEMRKIRTSIGYMPQKFSLYQDLSVAENMRFFADVFGIHKEECGRRIGRLLKFSHLESFVNRRAGNLSGGMKQKLALSCTLIHTPQVIFLDEPTTGVDPVSRKEFWNILHELKSQGVTIFISTPYMEEAALCDELVLLHHGRVAVRGTPSSLVSQFPLMLYRISSESEQLIYPLSGAIPAPVTLLYPRSGNLHAACPANAAPDTAILDAIKSVAPEARFIERMEPTIEDVFIYVLSTQNQAS